MIKNKATGSTKSIQVVKSPGEFMAVLNNRWKIDWDLACTDKNAQYDNYITETHTVRISHAVKVQHKLDQLLPGSFGVAWYGLSKNYLFLNPPFCNAEPVCGLDCEKIKCQTRGAHNMIPQLGIAKWMEKCKIESQRGAKIITLTLSSLGSKWYKEHVKGNANVWILEGRMTFEGHTDVYPKELLLCEWGANMNSLGFWDWKKEIPRDSAGVKRPSFGGIDVSGLY